MNDNSRLVTVFETGNIAILAVAKSTLDGAKIKYLVKGELLQNIIGQNAFGTNYNILAGPVQIQVTENKEAQARKILKGIK